MEVSRVYYVTDGGTELEPDTYWRYDEDSIVGAYYFRFVEIQDGAAGLHGVIQDEYGYSKVGLHLFDMPSMHQVTDGKELALVMLAIHG